MKQRYTLVSFLEPGLTHRIRVLQKEVSKLTGARASLDQWSPHISIGSEVWLEPGQVDKYHAQLAQAVKPIRPFTTDIGPFGFIDNWTGALLPGYTPYGMYLQIKVTQPFRELALAVKPVTDKWPNFFTMPWPYHPHITLAFKDLTATGYNHAKAAYETRTFSDITTINSISIAQKQIDKAGANVEVARIQLT